MAWVMLLGLIAPISQGVFVHDITLCVWKAEQKLSLLLFLGKKVLCSDQVFAAVSAKTQNRIGLIGYG